MVLTKSLIIHIIVYVAMGIISLMILFLLVRLIAQLIFIRECPRCKKTVSLAKSKLCPKCNYDFKQDSDPKYVIAVAILFIAFASFTTFDVYSFRNHMKTFQEANPYENVSSISTETSVNTEKSTQEK